ncbi:hypothetical protein ACGIF2_06500 [Cellulomonas sp. P22]|uniref:hypothetical protein n=1 Tax=Cellulomonas sp. P22 TaxID=3373189 RepID=UPI0037A0B1AE
MTNTHHAVIAQSGVDAGAPSGRSVSARPRHVGVYSTGVGVLIAALTVALRHFGVLTGPITLALVIAVALALPTAKTLSGRILLAGLIALGWSQTLWWWQLPFDRVTACLALGFGMAAGWIIARKMHLMGSRPLIPDIRVVDVIPLLTAAFGLFAFKPWITRDDGVSALALLLPGWDNSAHFNMFHMTWLHGSTIDAITPPTATNDWLYFNYPQGFHATAASLAQLMWPAAKHDVSSSLIAYNRITALLVTATVVTLVAGLCSMPRLRSRWDVAAPLAAVVSAGFFLGPGATSVQSGFASFVVPCALIGASMFVVVSMSRVAQPVSMLALCGAFLGVAHGWILLLVLAFPVAVASLLPMTKDRWRASRHAWTATALIIGATAFGIFRAARLVLGGTGGTSLSAPGAITPPPVGMVVVIATSSLGAGLIAVALLRKGELVDKANAWQVSTLISILPICVVVAHYLTSIQIRDHGTVGYYFWKFLLGSELILLALLSLAVSLIVPHEIAKKKPTGRVLTGIGVCALSLAGTQLYGYSGPSSVATGLVSTDTTTIVQDNFRLAPDAMATAASSLLSAARVLENSGIDSAYLETAPTSMDPINAQQWYLSLRGDWTTQGNFESVLLQGGQDSVETTIPVAERWLSSHSGTLVISPSLRQAFLDDARLVSYSDRIRAWS